MAGTGDAAPGRGTAPEGLAAGGREASPKGRAARGRKASPKGGAARGREAARSLAERCAAGDRAALARAISVVEDRRPGFRDLLAGVAACGRRAHRTGITGPPGAGKSTLVAELARRYREAGEEVAVIAVDPTSPFSGGAVLGDRVRMAPLQLDRGVFIRSMATRGAGGGLAEAVHDVADLMEGSGFGRILLETVGVGQTELGVAAAADTVLVVLTPESGDEVQAMKSGLAEVADVFVVNKADRPGARSLVRQLRDAVALASPRGGGGPGGGGRPTGPVAGEGAAPGSQPPVPAAVAGRGWEVGAGAGDEARAGNEAVAGNEVVAGNEAAAGGDPCPPWQPPVFAAVATTGEGIDAVAVALEDHRRRGAGSGELAARRVARAEERLRAGLRAAFERRLTRLAGDGGFAEAALAVAGREETVYDAVERLLARGGILPGTPARPAKSRPAPSFGGEQP